MKTLLRWAISAGSLYVTILILHALNLANLGAAPWYSWFIAVIIMALVNACIRPVARFMAAPLNCLTFGIVGVVINGLMFALVPFLAKGVLGSDIFSLKWPFGPILGAILVGVIQSAAGNLLIPKDDDQ
jgi:putative membrane protein